MPETFETFKEPARGDRLYVPSKSEILEALQDNGSRGGMQLEWVLDRCDKRDGAA